MVEARRIAAQKGAMRAQGHHPSNSITKTQSITFKDVFQLWYELNSLNWSKKTIENVLNRCTTYVFPYIDHFEISAIQPQHIIELLKNIEHSGKIHTLNKVRNYTSRVFRYGVGMGYCSVGPSRDIPRDIFQKEKEEHYACITDSKQISGVLTMMEEYPWDQNIGNALRLTPMYFCAYQS